MMCRQAAYSSEVDTLRVKKTRQNKNQSLGSDSIGTEQAAAPPATKLHAERLVNVPAGQVADAIVVEDSHLLFNGAFIVASAPNQTLSGFTASDTLFFNFAAVGQSAVTDFHPTTDTLRFSSSIFASVQP
jgi:hypothetical protein